MTLTVFGLSDHINTTVIQGDFFNFFFFLSRSNDYSTKVYEIKKL